MSQFYNPVIYRWGLYSLTFYIVDRLISSDHLDADRVGFIIEEYFSHTMISVVILSFTYVYYMIEEHDIYKPRKWNKMLTNHFYASTRLVSKRRKESSRKCSLKYDEPQMPYQRLLATLNPESPKYKKLVERRARLNPVELSRKAEEALIKLCEYLKQVKLRRENLCFLTHFFIKALQMPTKMLFCWMTAYFEALRCQTPVKCRSRCECRLSFLPFNQ